MVTIAIASYDNALYIERCINSVIKQSYNELEILVVDDGSKDDTLSRIKKYESSNQVKILTKANGGLSTVRQMALDHATGDYICFIDGDDYLNSDYVKNMLEKITVDRSDVCVCSTRFEDETGHLLPKETQSFRSKMSMLPIVTTPEVLSNDVMLHDLHLSDSWNKMYSISKLRNIGVRFRMPKGLNGSDTMFNNVVALHGLKYSTIGYEGYVHVIYRKSAVHRKNKNLNSSFQIICDNLINEGRQLNILEMIMPVISKKWYSWQYAIIEDTYSSSHSLSHLLAIIYEQKKYAKEKNFIPFKISDAKGFFAKSFVILYKYFPFAFPGYLMLRSKKR